MNRDDSRIAEGMKRQKLLRDQALETDRRLGWKSGFGTEGAMAHLGIDQPLTGFLTTATLADSGATVEVSEWSVPLLEAEVAVRIDSELGPGTTPEEASSAIGATAAAIELIDLGAVESIEDILAGNIFHRKVLLGDFRDCDPATLGLVRIAVGKDGPPSEPSDPRDVVGDLGKVVAALADQADLLGETIQPGDVVITGAAVPPAPAEPGSELRVELNTGSSVSVSFR